MPATWFLQAFISAEIPRKFVGLSSVVSTKATRYINLKAGVFLT